MSSFIYDCDAVLKIGKIIHQAIGYTHFQWGLKKKKITIPKFTITS